MSRDMQNGSFCKSDEFIPLRRIAAAIHATHPLDTWQRRLLRQYNLQSNKVHVVQINLL